MHFSCSTREIKALIRFFFHWQATIHWSFTCPYCSTTLHDQPRHYETRSKCLNELVDWYGYNPLLYSQYRADSLLFKTRIPSTKQKCYKFIWVRPFFSNSLSFALVGTCLMETMQYGARLCISANFFQLERLSLSSVPWFYFYRYFRSHIM